MKGLMNAKLFLKSNMSGCAAYDCSNSSKNNPGKTFFILPKNECTRKAWIVVINRKEDTLPNNVYLCSDHFEEVCFNKSWAKRHNYFTHHVRRKETYRSIEMRKHFTKGSTERCPSNLFGNYY